MLAAIFILTSTVTSLIEGILIKKYNQKYSSGGFIFTAIVSLFSMLFFLITDRGGLNFDFAMLPYGIISGILYCLASFLTFVALGCGPFALSMLILSYSGIFSIIYGIFFLKEDIKVFTAAGILLMFVSLFLTRNQKSQNEKKANLKWLVCIAVSAVGCGMFTVIQRMQQIRFDNAVTNEYMIVTLGISAIILFAIGLVKDRKNLKYILRHGTVYSAFAGFSNGATNFLVLVANGLMNISVLSPVRAGAKIVLSFLISRFIFKEKFLVRQVIGVLIGAAAIVLLNL